ncbi:hypothetical protein ACJ41O_006490 [Fusarium nematophilum]
MQMTSDDGLLEVSPRLPKSADGTPATTVRLTDKSPPESFIRGILLCHVRVNCIGDHYGIPKLCERANFYIGAILRGGWSGAVFLDVVSAVCGSSKDKALHGLISSFAMDHIQDLVATPGFAKLTTLEAFGPKIFGKCVARMAAKDEQLELEKILGEEMLVEEATQRQSLSTQVDELRPSHVPKWPSGRRGWGRLGRFSLECTAVQC